MGSEKQQYSIANANEIVFRPMRMDDIEDIMVIEHESFTLPWSSQAFHNELTQNQFARYLVMVKNDQTIGYAGMWTVMDEAHITNIAVRTAFRGQHLGQQLLEHLMEYAWELGMIRMTLEVRLSNHVAQSLYEKKGFKGMGLRKGYYSDNGEDALIMWCDLTEQFPEQAHWEGSEL